MLLNGSVESTCTTTRWSSDTGHPCGASPHTSPGLDPSVMVKKKKNLTKVNVVFICLVQVLDVHPTRV